MTSSVRISALAATLLAAPALVFAGCGDSGSGPASTATTPTAATTATTGASNTGKPASALLDEATAAVAAATSVHIVGVAASASGDSAQALDLTAGRNGNGEGTIHFAPGDIEVRVVDGTAYAKAPAGFWAAGGANEKQAAALGGTWVTAPAGGSGVATMTGFADMVNMAKVVDPILADFGTPTRGPAAKVNGVSTVLLTDATGNQLWLPAAGTPLPVKYHAAAKGKEGTVNYSKWNAPVSVTVPEGAVDLGNLGG